MARIAMLRSSSQDLPDREPIASSLSALRAGLREQGYVDGVDYTIDYRVPRGDADIAAQAGAVVARNVEVIHAAGPLAVLAASRATATIPIVAVDYETNPVATGLVDSLGRPGHNITGMFLDRRSSTASSSSS
jgi:putative ABC transport system substrate-binding protein